MHVYIYQYIYARVQKTVHTCLCMTYTYIYVKIYVYIWTNFCFADRCVKSNVFWQSCCKKDCRQCVAFSVVERYSLVTLYSLKETTSVSCTVITLNQFTAAISWANPFVFTSPFHPPSHSIDYFYGSTPVTIFQFVCVFGVWYTCKYAHVHMFTCHIYTCTIYIHALHVYHVRASIHAY